MNTTPTSKNMNATMMRDMRFHRRDIMRDHPDMALEDVNRLAEQRARCGKDNDTFHETAKLDCKDNDTKVSIGAKKKKTKAVAKKKSAPKATTKQPQQPVFTTRQHDTQPVQNLSEQVRSTASVLAGMVQKTAGIVWDETKQPMDRQSQVTDEQPEDASDELETITVETARRLGQHIGETAWYSVMWSAKIACVSTIVKIVSQVSHAILKRGGWSVLCNPWNQFEPSYWIQFISLLGFALGIVFVPPFAVQYPKEAVILTFAGIGLKGVFDSWYLVLLHIIGYGLVYGWAKCHQRSLLNTARLGESGFGSGKVKMGKVGKLALRSVSALNTMCVLLALAVGVDLCWNMASTVPATALAS